MDSQSNTDWKNKKEKFEITQKWRSLQRENEKQNLKNIIRENLEKKYLYQRICSKCRWVGETLNFTNIKKDGAFRVPFPAAWTLHSCLGKRSSKYVKYVINLGKNISSSIWYPSTMSSILIKNNLSSTYVKYVHQFRKKNHWYQSNMSPILIKKPNLSSYVKYVISVGKKIINKICEICHQFW